MKTRIAFGIVALLTAGTGLGAYALAGSGQSGRPDCPGTVVCPLTGEPVCRDQCPAGSETTAPAPVGGCCAEPR